MHRAKTDVCARRRVKSESFMAKLLGRAPYTNDTVPGAHQIKCSRTRHMAESEFKHHVFFNMTLHFWHARRAAPQVLDAFSYFLSFS